MKVNIILDKNEYYPGDYLTGSVKLEPDEKTSIKDIEMSLFLIEDWNHLRSDKKYETSNNTQCISVFYIRLHLFLDKSTNGIVDLNKEEYSFPFEEKLPDYLLPSFEFPQNKFRAFLRYTLTAKVMLSTDKSISSTVFLNINAIPKKGNDLKTRSSINKNKWGLINKGLTELKVKYFTQNYKISDKIPVEVEIDNSKSKMKVIECKLKVFRKISFRDKNDFSVKYFQNDNVIRNVSKINVNKKEKKKLNFDIDLKTIDYKDFNYNGFTNPYKSNNIEYKDLIPSLDGSIIACEYSIETILKFEHRVKKEERPKINFPIYIVHKLSDNHIKEAQKEEELKEKERNENNYGGFEILELNNPEKDNNINNKQNNQINDENNIKNPINNNIINNNIIGNNNIYNNLNNNKIFNNKNKQEDEDIEQNNNDIPNIYPNIDNENNAINHIYQDNNNINNKINNEDEEEMD